ncbi:MAG TPA: hypothetical protein VFT43_01365 [Candidatus Polarisedimenticolia bacterium]|nr:hypothetical protein [Candidatus Polarisedimenticolia bacterium]
MFLLVGILMTLATAALVLAPLVRHQAAPLTDGPDEVALLRELYAVKDVTYEAIRDLEFDFHAGKISESDYRELTGRYKIEALRVVERIDAVEARLPRPGGRSRGTK